MYYYNHSRTIEAWPMKSESGSGRPVLMTRKRRGRKRTVQSENTPESLESQAPRVETAADHSLVPPAPKKLLEPAEFFRYWHSIPKRERDAWFIGYPYRKLPVCDVTQPLSVDELRAIERRQKKKPDTNCGKLSEPFDPDNWERDVNQWKGAGDYQIRLNDQHPSVKGTVCETHIRGLRDWDNFPPILNLDEVLLDEPLNQPYLRWARLRGIRFPGDPGNDPATPFDGDQEEDNMANVAAVEKLTDALIEQTKHRPQPAAPAAPAPDRSNEILADAALKGQSILLESIKQQAKAADPKEFHAAVVEAAKAMIPTAPATAATGPTLSEIMQMVTTMMAPVQAANTAMMAAADRRAEAAERRAETLETRLHTQQNPAAAPAVDPMKAALELIKGLASLREIAGPILGDTAAAPPGSVWERLAEKALDGAPSFIHNLAVLKTGQGTPSAPPDLDAELIAEETRPGSNTPELKTEDTEVFSNRKIAENLAAPLIESLNRNDRGFQFAAGMILQDSVMGFPGEMVYKMAVNKGKDGMYQILQSYPELWQKLIQIPKRVDAFLDDFLNTQMAHAIAAEARNPAATPEVLPPEPQQPNGAPRPEGKPGGRTIIDGTTGKPIRTA